MENTVFTVDFFAFSVDRPSLEINFFLSFKKGELGLSAFDARVLGYILAWLKTSLNGSFLESFVTLNTITFADMAR